MVQPPHNHQDEYLNAQTTMLLHATPDRDLTGQVTSPAYCDAVGLHRLLWHHARRAHKSFSKIRWYAVTRWHSHVMKTVKDNADCSSQQAHSHLEEDAAAFIQPQPPQLLVGQSPAGQRGDGEGM